uniref:Secreted protein n=1 Tax=Timema monikensis TaxID=170555 RepID=A0A7R9E707_9NEOP|nr:unnamed protein product [Timema monikensis]
MRPEACFALVVLFVNSSLARRRGNNGGAVDRDYRDPITITCDFEATPALQLKAFRQKGEKVEVSHYRVICQPLPSQAQHHLCHREDAGGYQVRWMA